jgi:streptomycin 6-kinase
VKLLDVDWDATVMLLERVEPGVSLKADGDDEKVMNAVADVMREIARPIADTAHFQTLTEWAEAFHRVRDKHAGTSGPFNAALFDHAERIFSEYTQTAEQHYLLHGDLHNDNILSSQNGWMAIDPKGVIGPIEYETAAFLRNPYYDLPNETNLKDRLERRITILSDALQFDKNRIVDWTFAQAMLSAVWTLEDHGKINTDYTKAAELFSEITFQ